MAKPANYLGWVPGGGAAIALPPLDQRSSGWTVGEPVPAQYANWLFYTLDKWIQWLDQKSYVARNNQTFAYDRLLLSSGVWSYDDATGTFTWPSFTVAHPGMPDSIVTVSGGSMVLSVDQCVYIAFASPRNFVATSTSGSNQLTNVSYITTIITPNITGPGIPAGATITASNPNANVITLSANATSSNVNATYTSYTVPLAVVGSTTWDVYTTSPNNIIIARRIGSTIHVGVNATQMILRHLESKKLVEEGYTSVFRGVAGQTIATRQAVYISAGSAAGDTGRTAGLLYNCDSSANAVNQYRVNCIGISTHAATLGQNIFVVMSGSPPTTFGSSDGLIYVEPTTPGALTKTKPTGVGQYIVPVGSQSTQFIINPTTSAVSSTYAGPPALIRLPLQTLQLSNPPNSSGVLPVLAPGLNVPWEFRMLAAGTYSIAAFSCMASYTAIGASGSVSSTLFKNGGSIAGSTLTLQSANQKPSVTWAAGTATFSGGLIDSIGIQYVINATTWTGGPGGITWQVWIYANA